MATSPCRSDEILEPGRHHLDAESLDPAVIPAVGVTSPHGVALERMLPNSAHRP